MPERLVVETADVLKMSHTARNVFTQNGAKKSVSVGGNPLLMEDRREF